MLVAKCHTCGWIGTSEELGLYYSADREYCPRCKETERLSYIDKDDKFDSQEVEKLWEIFGDVPVGDDDLIQDYFLGFSEGTNRFEIWQWFDSIYQGGVAKLVTGEN